MRIRTLIIGAALAVVVVANVAYTGYFLDKERREARARLQLTIDSLLNRITIISSSTTKIFCPFCTSRSIGFYKKHII